MNEIARDYYRRHGYEKWATRAEKEAREIQKQHRYHRTHAEVAWQKSETSNYSLNVERENIAKFIAVWVPALSKSVLRVWHLSDLLQKTAGVGGTELRLCKGASP